MKKIYLSKQGWKNKGKYTIVDDEDYEHINQFRWCFGNGGYAITGNTEGKPPRRIMHRVILNAPDDMEVDHINNDKLDNRRRNLRICSHKQNIWNNSTRSDNKSGFRGVGWYKPYKKWRVRITYNGKEYHLGYYNELSDAVSAYSKKAEELYKEFANRKEQKCLEAKPTN